MHRHVRYNNWNVRLPNLLSANRPFFMFSRWSFFRAQIPKREFQGNQEKLQFLSAFLCKNRSRAKLILCQTVRCKKSSSPSALAIFSVAIEMAARVALIIENIEYRIIDGFLFAEYGIHNKYFIVYYNSPSKYSSLGLILFLGWF